MFALAAAHVSSGLREDFSPILNALKFVYKCRCSHLLIAACFPIHHPSLYAEVSRNRPCFDNKIQCMWIWLTSFALFFFFMLLALFFFLLQLKPPVLPLPPSQQSVVAAPSDRPPPASRNFCTSCFSGSGYDVWSRGERSRGPGVLELASTGSAAPLPLSLPLLIWHSASTFCSIVLSMN